MVDEDEGVALLAIGTVGAVGAIVALNWPMVEAFLWGEDAEQKCEEGLNWDSSTGRCRYASLCDAAKGTWTFFDTEAERDAYDERECPTGPGVPELIYFNKTGLYTEVWEWDLKGRYLVQSISGNWRHGGAIGDAKMGIFIDGQLVGETPCLEGGKTGPVNVSPAMEGSKIVFAATTDGCWFAGGRWIDAVNVSAVVQKVG